MHGRGEKPLCYISLRSIHWWYRRTIPEIKKWYWYLLLVLTVNITVRASDPAAHIPVKFTLHSDSNTTAPLLTTSGTSNTPFQFHVDSPKLWSPTAPNLYHFTVQLEDDVVTSYLGFRTIERRSDPHGIVRPFLNGEFVFQLGPLDQGFWPDGTSPVQLSIPQTLLLMCLWLCCLQVSIRLLHMTRCNMTLSSSNS